MIGRILGIAAGAGLLAGLLWLVPFDRSQQSGPDAARGTDLRESLARLVEQTRYPAVPHPWRFDFPRDHLAHERYRMDAWRLAGVLTDEHGRRLGVQLLLLRLGLGGQGEQRVSDWAARDLYAGLLLLTDPLGGGLRTAQRLARGAAGLAGAGAVPQPRIWIEDWRLEPTSAADGSSRWRLQAQDADLALHLRLQGPGPPTDAGQLAAAEPAGTGAPLQFYLEPRLAASGRLTLDGYASAVEGPLALEHAWGELPLPGGPVVQDRLSLHLDDGTNLLLLRTRRADASGSARTTGLLLRPGRPAVALGPGAVEWRPAEFWVSPRSGGRYPVRWSLRVPAENIDLALRGLWPDQEGEFMARFWAGPVDAYDAQAAPRGVGFLQYYGSEIR